MRILKVGNRLEWSKLTTLKKKLRAAVASRYGSRNGEVRPRNGTAIAEQEPPAVDVG
jgi:hypothetical protein